MENLLLEAGRCLKCKKPRCQMHCPIYTSVPEVITLFEEGKIHEAGQILFENNPLSAICAIVCPHEDQCLGNCIRGIKSEPVRFCDIEAYISMEEKMACGIGACLACVCKSKDVDHHSHVNNKRVCKDGPVFNVLEVEL